MRRRQFADLLEHGVWGRHHGMEAHVVMQRDRVQIPADAATGNQCWQRGREAQAAVDAAEAAAAEKEAAKKAAEAPPPAPAPAEAPAEAPAPAPVKEDVEMTDAPPAAAA